MDTEELLWHGWKDVTYDKELRGETITKGSGYFEKSYVCIKIPYGYGYDNYCFLLSKKCVNESYFSLHHNMNIELFMDPELREQGKKYKRYKLSGYKLFETIFKEYEIKLEKEYQENAKREQESKEKRNKRKMGSVICGRYTGNVYSHKHDHKYDSEDHLCVFFYTGAAYSNKKFEKVQNVNRSFIIAENVSKHFFDLWEDLMNAYVSEYEFYRNTRDNMNARIYEGSKIKNETEDISRKFITDCERSMDDIQKRLKEKIGELSSKKSLSINLFKDTEECVSMKKYYIVDFNGVAEFLGEYEDMGYAKDDAFAKMDDEDMLVGFDSNIEPEYTDDFGFNRVKLELADEEEQSCLLKTDGTMEDIPKGLWFWSDEDEPIYYNSDGKEWDGFHIEYGGDWFIDLYIDYKRFIIEIDDMVYIADKIKIYLDTNPETALENCIKENVYKTMQMIDEQLSDKEIFDAEQREECIKELKTIYKKLWEEREALRIISKYKETTKEMFNPINGQTPASIEQTVREYVESIIKAERIDAGIIDVAISGSRSRGLEQEGSDLDVVIEYAGDVREDEFFNILHNTEFKIEGVTVDVNPITKNKTGDMGYYLLKAEAYLNDLSKEREAAKESVKESGTNNLKENEFDRLMLPDTLQLTDMYKYGYKYEGMLPLTRERATELYDNDVTVYKLHPDDSETAVENKEIDIEQHEGMFGIEKRDWLIYLRDKIELMSEAEREGLINGVEAGFDNGYDIALEDIAIYHCLNAKVKLPTKISEHSTGIEPVDKKGLGYEQTFRVIDKAHYNGQDLFLLESESEEYLDGNVIVDENGNIIMENVESGFEEYLECRRDLVDRYDLRNPISLRTNSDDIVRISKYFKLPYNLKFVDTQNNAYKVYIGTIGDSQEQELILKTSEGNYIYSTKFNMDYINEEVFLTDALDMDEYKFVTLSDSERKRQEQPVTEHITPRERQQQEIETIKERYVTLKLSYKDCYRLARKAGQAGMSIGELLEGFIGDLVDGTYTHGSDEYDLAQQWFKRCGFGSAMYEESLLQNLINNCYDVEDFIDVCDNIKECEEDLIKSKEHPEDYDKEEIEFLEEDLDFYKGEFNDFTEDFRSNHEEVIMTEEIELCRKWVEDYVRLKEPELVREYKR